MSEARMADMAVIDAALINPRSLDPGDIEARKALIESENDPITEQPQDQHEAISSPLTEIAKELSQEDQEKENQKQVLFQQQQRSLLKAKVQATGQSASRAIGSVQNGLGRVSMPGGLLAPLLILVVFFFLLVQVNGHTRLTWLWLVATQNAAIPTEGGGAFSTFGDNTNTGGGGSENTHNGTGGGMPAVETLPVYVPLEMDEW